MYKSIIKRMIDFTLSLVGLVILSPLLIIISIIIKCTSKGPILFKQKRVGKNKKHFNILKFRTMRIDTPKDCPTHLLENPDQYITGIGKFLRKTSLDELPQIINILKGDMSIIGPRPALWNQYDLIEERDKYKANDIYPGLTGWAQINGRDELEIDVKAKLDGEYVERISFLFDIKCFFGTITSVMKSDGVVEGGTGEMKKNIDMSIFENEKKVTISIVTYNSKDEIDILMESLQSNAYFDNMTIYLVDNASIDGTAEYVKDKYPWARVIASKDNLGFGKGHNIIIRNVHSDYHIIVNPDISIPYDSIKKAINYMINTPNVAVMTPFVKNTDGSQQHLPKKNPSMKYLIGGMFEKKISFCEKWRDEYTLKKCIITEPINVEFCTGAFMITNTKKLQSVGGFDEKYFLHFEDADLTRELRKVGRAVYNPDIKVIHKWHRENKKINKSFFVALKSMFIYLRKWS